MGEQLRNIRTRGIVCSSSRVEPEQTAGVTYRSLSEGPLRTITVSPRIKLTRNEHLGQRFLHPRHTIRPETRLPPGRRHFPHDTTAGSGIIKGGVIAAADIRLVLAEDHSQIVVAALECIQLCSGPETNSQRRFPLSPRQHKTLNETDRY